ncbi:hypothetical protein B6D60_05010 [candidate division KSB1 bacterium 4484_87]|nr:MAG: hypothetical protein B6D60_05010 [candidate division KSB1 bacterium 4484_87]
MGLDELLPIVAVFFGVYIVLQIIIAKRLNIIIKYLFDILIVLRGSKRKSRFTKRYTEKKNCSACKYRVPYLDLNRKSEQLIYYRCRLTNRKVEPLFVCEHFILEPQQKGAGK